MFLDPWTTSRLAALHRDELARVAPARRPGGADGGGRGRHPLAQRVGALLIAAGRRLGGETTRVPALVPGGRMTH